MNYRLPLTLALGLSLIHPLTADITNVTIDDNGGGDYPTLLRQHGTLLDAVNLGHAGENILLNGIPFLSAPGLSPSGENWSATGTATAGDLSQTGIDHLFFSELLGGTVTLTYRNLDPERTYLLQILHGEPRTCCATTYSNNSLSTDVDEANNLEAFQLGNGVHGEDPPATADIAIISAEISGATTVTYTARPGTARYASVAGFQLRQLGDPVVATGDRPFISEFVATGNDDHQDSDGDTPDWIEIYNPTSEDIDLNGYHLTDDPTDPRKWTFPSTLLQAESYLLLFASSKDRDTPGSELHTNFRLSSGGEYLALLSPDGTTILSHFAPAYPPQESDFSHGVGGLEPDGTTGYFATATPGSENGILLPAPLLAPVIDPPCGSFLTNTTVTLQTQFPDGIIRYTIDGRAPTRTSAIYRGPLTFTNTTHLRARVFNPDTGDSGEIASAHYQKLSASAGGGLPAPSRFTSNLPIIVVETFGRSSIPGPGSSYGTARINVHEVDPVTGRSSLADPPTACFRIGIRRRGQSSSGFPKPQYRVELRDDNDVDTEYPLLGLPEESDWVFNGPYTDKALIRNPFAFQLGRTIGIQAPRTRHFEMFLSANGGSLSNSEYVGVYALFEKIKDDRNRIDLANLEPTHSTSPEITGGYLMRFEPPGIAGQGIRATGWSSVEIIEPQRATGTQQRWIGRYLDRVTTSLGGRKGQANNSGTPNSNPLTGYPSLIDVDSFVSLFLINELLREQDSYVRSDYMHKDRDGKLIKGPLWDYNLTAGTGCCFDNRNTMGWQYLHDYNRGGRDHSYEPDWFVPLMRCPDFRQRVIDRWGELRRSGILHEDQLFALIDSLADPLAEASRRNFRRWNILQSSNVGFPSPSTSTWQEQIVVMKDWLSRRMTWIDSEFPEDVTIETPSGVVSPGTQITLRAPTTIFYTTDGTDPRDPGGRPSRSATPIASGRSLTIDESVDVTARIRLGSSWSAPITHTFIVGHAPTAQTLAVTEINYHPSDPTEEEIAADPTYRDDDFEFFELRNLSDEPIDLGGAAFTEGISFRFPAGSVLAPGAYGVVVEHQAAFEERYGADLPVLGVYANKLRNDGDTVRLIGVDGSDLAHFTFNDVWYRLTDGRGHTLSSANDGAIPADYNHPVSWGISGVRHGTPGAANGPLAHTFDGWTSIHFPQEERADPVISGPNSDPDADGLVNLLEYALQLDPKTFGLSGLPPAELVTVGDDRYLALTVRRLTKALDLDYAVEVSSDLRTWTRTSTQVGSTVPHEDGTQSVTFRDTVPLGASGLRFIRIVAEAK